MALDKQKIARAAEELARKGQFDKAIQELQRVVREDPSDDFFWLKIGDLYVKKGDTKQGAACYLQAAGLYADRDPQKAIKVLQYVLSLDPSRVECHQRLALLYHSQGQDREAVEQLEPYATYFEQNQKFDEAIQVRQRMLDLVPDHLPVRVKLAEIYSQLNRRDDAVREFAKVAKQLKGMNRVNDYVMVVERLLFHKPDDKEHLLAVAKVYLEQNNAKEALNKLQGLFIIDPKNLDVLELLAETFLGLGQGPKAVRVLKEIARQRPEMKNALFKRIQEVDPSDADVKAHFQSDEAPRVNVPINEPGLSLVGIPSLPSQVAKLPKGAGSPTPGSEKAEKEAKVSKKIAEAELYIKFGLQEKAIDHLQDALALIPDHQKLLRLLKDLYIGIADYAKAVPLLLSLAQKAPPEEAKQLLQQLFSYDPRHEAARALYQKLGGSFEEELDEADLIEEEPEEDLLEEVAELVEQVEAQEAAVLKTTGSGRARAGSTMISMSPFFEVAEVAEVVQPRSAFKTEPYSAMGAPIPEGSEHLFGYSELTNRTSPDAARAAVARNQETTQVEQGLSDIDTYLQQGLDDDARALLNNLAQMYPNNPLVQQRVAEFNAPYEENEGMVDDHTGAQAGVGSPFENGLAYRERGQIDEAIREFQSLVGSGIGDAICYHLIGVCYGDKGRYPEAIDAFKRALHIGGLSFEDELGIYYALGATHEAIGDRAEAIYYYQRVYQRDQRFRDVAQRIQQLQRAPQKKNPNPPNRAQESGASPLPVRRDQVPAQAIARSRDDDDRYS